MIEHPQPQITEPLTVGEVAVFLGCSWKAAKQFCESIGEKVGTSWQIPLSRMPAAYFVARFRPISSDFVQFKTYQHDAPDSAYSPDMQPLMSERDTAIHLRISLADLNAIVEGGQLPFVPVGNGEIRFKPADVAALIERLRTKATTTEF